MSRVLPWWSRASSATKAALHHLADHGTLPARLHRATHASLLHRRLVEGEPAHLTERGRHVVEGTVPEIPPEAQLVCGVGCGMIVDGRDPEQVAYLERHRLTHTSGEPAGPHARPPRSP